MLSEGGKVRYSSRSTSLRDAKAWVRLCMELPTDSYSARTRAGAAASGPEAAEPDRWFDDWERDGALYEDVRHLGAWDQTLTLLWFDDDLPPPPTERQRWEEETYGLRELDGELPWPGKSRRRK